MSGTSKNTDKSVLFFFFFYKSGRKGLPCWTCAGSAAQWCGSASDPGPPSGRVFCCGGAAAGLLCPAAPLAVQVNTWGELNLKFKRKKRKEKRINHVLCQYKIQECTHGTEQQQNMKCFNERVRENMHLDKSMGVFFGIFLFVFFFTNAILFKAQKNLHSVGWEHL